MFTTYILYSASLGKYYIGFTAGNINSRLSKHLGEHTGFTAKAKDWVVVHIETFITKTEAMAREKQLKRWKSNQRIKQLIERGSTE